MLNQCLAHSSHSIDWLIASSSQEEKIQKLCVYILFTEAMVSPFLKAAFLPYSLTSPSIDPFYLRVVVGMPRCYSAVEILKSIEQ